MSTLTQIEQRYPIQNSWCARDALMIVAASLLISLCAPIAIPLPFTPVPLAIQAQVCLFFGVLLGSKRIALAVMGFLLQGACGLPVFAKGATGLAYLFGPTGGYLLGYLLGAFITGYLVEKKTGERTMRSVFLAMAAGNLVIFVLGWLQLSRFIGMNSAVILGVLPFLLGDFLKLCFAGRFLKTLKICR
ncbi:MAG: biotin transporter BioY [Simkania sp.]|nr:biotin transporter BioY [Simkania sp.]